MVGGLLELRGEGAQCRRLCTRRSSRRRTMVASLAGLPHVGLAEILVYGCPAGHGVVPRIPRAGELHRLIAEASIEESGSLIGAELRLLRKHAGISAQTFAALRWRARLSTDGRPEGGQRSPRNARPGRPAAGGVLQCREGAHEVGLVPPEGLADARWGTGASHRRQPPRPDARVGGQVPENAGCRCLAGSVH